MERDERDAEYEREPGDEFHEINEVIHALAADSIAKAAPFGAAFAFHT